MASLGGKRHLLKKDAKGFRPASASPLRLVQPLNSSVLSKSYNDGAHQTVFSGRGSHDPYFAHQSKTTTLEMSTINQDQQQLKRRVRACRVSCVCYHQVKRAGLTEKTLDELEVARDITVRKRITKM